MNKLYESGPAAGATARDIRDGLARARAGVKIRTWWGGDGLDEAGLRVWFQRKIDESINLKGGLRSDGAARKARCSCWCCRDLRVLRKLYYGLHGKVEHCCHGGGSRGNGRPSALVHEVGTHCYAWGGRKWDWTYQVGFRRDQSAIRDKIARRVRLYYLETPECRERFAHLVSERED